MKKRQNLIKARRQAHLTQAQLAERIGTTKQRVCNLETVVCSTSPEIWDKIEDILGVPQRQLREVSEV